VGAAERTRGRNWERGVAGTHGLRQSVIRGRRRGWDVSFRHVARLRTVVLTQIPHMSDHIPLFITEAKRALPSAYDCASATNVKRLEPAVGRTGKTVRQPVRVLEKPRDCPVRIDRHRKGGPVGGES